MVLMGSQVASQEESHPYEEAAGPSAGHAAKLEDSQVVHPSQDTENTVNLKVLINNSESISRKIDFYL